MFIRVTLNSDGDQKTPKTVYMYIFIIILDRTKSKYTKDP